jgi:broad specificity phosphatase PhoE
MILLHRFWLIRHALVHADSLRFLYGTNDVPICDSTMAANAAVYAALAARLPRDARWVCTPLSRTQLTAAAIMRAGYPVRTPLIDPAFVEQNFGALQGLPIADFEARDAAARHPFWPIHALEKPPGGESFDDMILRVGNGLETLVESAGEAENTVIVTHGGAIRAACAHALQLTAHQALCLAVENISLTRLEHTARGWRMVSLNEQLFTASCEMQAASSFSQAHHKQTEGTST